jgi:hypothetical protein
VVMDIGELQVEPLALNEVVNFGSHDSSETGEGRAVEQSTTAPAQPERDGGAQ